MASTLPDPSPDARTTSAEESAPVSRASGGVESHGIDHIPDSERRGRPRELFSVWAAANVNYLSLVVGGALVLTGLSLWQALAVVVVGNLFWLLTGLLAVPGPAAGAPSEVITRTLYGVRGNRVNNAVTGWLISVCYFALNLAAAATAAFSLVGDTGLPVNTAVKTLVVVLIAALTLAISVWGHAAIVRLYLPITLVLAAVFAVLAVVVLRHTDFGYVPARPLTGTALWATVLAGTALIASGPLSYTTSADFSRYLPRATPARAVAGWTAFGGFLPSVLVCGLGACAATAVDMNDPESSLQPLLPAWFRPLFLLALVLGTIALNALTAYSAGLALQAVGLRIRRQVSVLVDGTVSVSLTLYALLVSNFLDTVGDVLQLTVVLLGPSTAVYAVDIVLRRNRYDGPALADETPAGPFWFTAGVNWRGALALCLGVAASALGVDTVYTGPLAAALGGVDVALPAGLVVSAVAYALLARPDARSGRRPEHP
ncbi:nitrate reductase [Streptomyces sp. SID8366]|uniref:purine-cytosine permease family protein n=1 Tax=unclassified Streptomyces TaxID=2593676 RepID=UPI000DB98A8D|nr:cytosine permease [Streptomyces sp. PsTaAH-130]MYU04438.1 nitrate reductase [Streptomyces sp. SID8366]MYU65204.1 nitrate reductase [Streptomyces sp. SID69]RAJ54786.1 purine-cytosine permease-like protein [Streptomyces sp. PsTaAH-130]